MPVWLECDSCGNEHTISERVDDPGGGTCCPECGERPYTVRRTDIVWHPDP